MPVYQYKCSICRDEQERIAPVADRHKQLCDCGAILELKITAAAFKFAGRVTKGGGPDKFTADMLGIPLHDLPSGLRTDSPANTER